MSDAKPFSHSHPLPPRIAALPPDPRGYPVPWFVEWVDGVPDFRVVSALKIGRALVAELCWVCGRPLGRFRAFVIGPMCAVNRVSAEPPSHRDCAEFSARACPFLSNPDAPRRTTRMPDGVGDLPGLAIKRNPGVTLVWVTHDFQVERADGGVLFRLGPPAETLWYARGRPATRAEVLASIESGLPVLRSVAEKEGAAAVRALGDMVELAMTYVPAA